MLYSYIDKHIYWLSGRRISFKGYHVTPYLSEILAQGSLLPPNATQRSVLGENVGRRTIRGCLLSFFGDFQAAMSGCYNLALYAILDKKLLTDNEFERLMQSEVSRYGVSDEDDMFVDLSDTDAVKIMKDLYRSGDTGALFNILGRALDPFKNPVVLTDAWVLDLPDSIDGILNAIGVLEVDFDYKYIADPSTLAGGFESSTYGYTSSKGDFGVDLNDLNAHYNGLNEDVGAFDELFSPVNTESTRIAHFINEVCKSTSVQLLDNDVKRTLENTFWDFDGFESVPTQYGESWKYTHSPITFVSSVVVNPQDLAIWNPEEHEWRIPAPMGIPVSTANVVALAGEVSMAVGDDPSNINTLVYKDSKVRGRRNCN